MARNRNTDIRGLPFNKAIVDQVWSKGRVIPNYNPSVWRYDICGLPMESSDHGDTNSQHGWEIDHIKPVAKGGGDELSNLQPMQWENNRKKGDTYPWSC